MKSVQRWLRGFVIMRSNARSEPKRAQFRVAPSRGDESETRAEETEIEHPG